MKRIFIWFIMATMIIGCRREEKPKPIYEVEQKIYSVSGKDSVKTKVFYWYNGFIGKGIYYKESPLSDKRKDSLDAIRFIEIHKKYNYE